MLLEITLTNIPIEKKIGTPLSNTLRSTIELISAKINSEYECDHELEVLRQTLNHSDDSHEYYDITFELTSNNVNADSFEQESMYIFNLALDHLNMRGSEAIITVKDATSLFPGKSEEEFEKEYERMGYIPPDY